MSTFTRRALTSATGLALAASGLVAFAASPSYAAGPAYQMPFGCNQAWLGKTYSGHSPSLQSIDWTHGGTTANQPVLASADGVVSTATTLTNPDGSYRSYGKYVVIDHGNGSTTLYAHLNGYDVSAGTRVARGQKIGIVGNTGNSSGAHLHYEQRYNGTVKQSVFDGEPFQMGTTLTSRNCSDTTTPPAPTGQWRAQVAVESGGGLYHAVRNADRTWTGFGDVQGVTGAVPGGVRTTAEAGVNGDTHVLAVTNEGKLFHSIRFADRSWSDFGDVAGEAGQLANITHVAAVSSGTEVQVVVVADGKVYHTVRRANGTWAPFGAVGNPGGAPVTKVALSQTGTDTQVVAVSGGSLFHTVRHANGTWTNWGDASAETGVSGIEEVAVAGTGGDLQLVVTTEGGAKRFHGARFASGQWVMNDLSSVVPAGVTVTDVAAAQVNNELQAAFVTTDGRVLHTIRAVSGSWSPAAPVDLAGVPGTRTGVSITGTYN
ncbi:M23 family metallopeptidase [Streptomyces sp. NPDC090077]|uniref:M23 family metallopeptidase n=1 Tax=Streptomyces sp. NPDC090077 TaxID=3365938 RepID=UPI0038276A2C